MKVEEVFYNYAQHSAQQPIRKPESVAISGQSTIS